MAFGAGFGIHRAATGWPMARMLPELRTGQGLVVLLGHIGIAITAIVLITVAANVAAEQRSGNRKKPSTVISTPSRQAMWTRNRRRPRIEALTETLRVLRARNSELAAAIEDEELIGPSPEELDTLRARIRGPIDHGPVTLRKATFSEGYAYPPIRTQMFYCCEGERVGRRSHDQGVHCSSGPGAHGPQFTATAILGRAGLRPAYAELAQASRSPSV